MATKPPSGLPTEQEYYLALGHFVDEFSATEMYFHVTFHAFARINNAIAAAIKGGMRMDDLFAALRRVMEINGFTQEHRDALAGCIQQFGEVSDLRNRILHQGAQLQPDGMFLASNFATTRSIDKPVRTRFTIEQIHHCVTDLSVIRQCVLALAFPEAAIPQINDFLDRAKHPWRYKGLRPNSGDQPRRKAPPKRERPPPSSQG